MTTTRGHLGMGIIYATTLWGELRGQACRWRYPELPYLERASHCSSADLGLSLSRAAFDPLQLL